MDIRLRRPSLGTVLGALALFVALGGPAQAARLIGGKQIKNNSVTSKDLKNRTIVARDVKANALGGGQVNESSLAEVPRAAAARRAETADNAATLGGTSAAELARVEDLAPGQVTNLELDNDFAPIAGLTAPGFYVDSGGLVHLVGAAAGGVDSVAFDLPEAVAPGAVKRFPVACDDGVGEIFVSDSGAVEVGDFGVGTECDQFVSFEGVVVRPGS